MSSQVLLFFLPCRSTPVCTFSTSSSSVCVCVCNHIIDGTRLLNNIFFKFDGPLLVSQQCGWPLVSHRHHHHHNLLLIADLHEEEEEEEEEEEDTFLAVPRIAFFPRLLSSWNLSAFDRGAQQQWRGSGSAHILLLCPARAAPCQAGPVRNFPLTGKRPRTHSYRLCKCAAH